MDQSWRVKGGGRSCERAVCEELGDTNSEDAADADDADGDRMATMSLLRIEPKWLVKKAAGG